LTGGTHLKLGSLLHPKT